VDKGKDKQRNQRLQTFFQISTEWDDLKQELEQIYKNADDALKNISCEHREIYIGKCLAVQEILDLEKGFRKEK
jgi:hypothetical protein